MDKCIDKYIYVSEFSKEILEINDKYKKGIVIGNPINIKNSDNKNINEPGDIIYIGRLEVEKGVLLLAKAARDLSLDITFIGEGKCNEEIKRIYINAIITGWLTKDEIQEELERTKILVAPSLLYETLGVAPIEALSNGIPVIVPKQSAASEFIVDGVNGYKFDSGNLEDLKDKINKLILDIRRNKINNVGIPEGYNLNDNDKYLAEIMKTYNKLL